MATNVFMMKDGTVTLGPTVSGISVECQITEAIISAAPDPKEATTLCGKVTIPGITAFTLNLGYLQDWTIDTGISMFLFENDGQLVDFELVPTANAAPMAVGKCYISPGDFGGTAGEIMVGAVSLGLEGKPTITGSAALPLATTAKQTAKQAAA